MCHVGLQGTVCVEVIKIPYMGANIAGTKVDHFLDLYEDIPLEVYLDELGMGSCM